MAADTREPSNSVSAAPKNQPTSQTQNTQHGLHPETRSPQSDNAFAAVGSQNTAGGKVHEPGFMEALRSVKPSEFTEVHKKPCVRDALLTGIGGGFGLGGARAILGGSILSSSNWAVGSFIFGSALMYEFCQRRRSLEKQGMKRAVEVIEQTKAEKQQKMEEARAARRKAKEEADARS
ncbi:hypothetical protein ACLMJK_000170 [Lecanora helva]